MIHITMAEKFIPQMGNPSDFWIPGDARRVYWVGVDGKTVDLTPAIDAGAFPGLSVALLHEIVKLQSSVDDLLANNKHAAAYVADLRTKAAARSRKK